MLSRQTLQGMRRMVTSVLVLMCDRAGEYLDGHGPRAREPKQRTGGWRHHIPVLEHGSHATKQIDRHHIGRHPGEVIVADRCGAADAEERIGRHGKKQLGGDLLWVPLHQELHHQSGVPANFIAGSALRKDL